MTTPTLPPVPVRSIRAAGPRELANATRAIDAARIDLVVPRAQLHINPLGFAELAGLEPIITDSGVTDINGAYVFTPKALGDLAPENVTGIPVRYLRRLASDHPDLMATNINTLLERDTRPGKFLVRALYGSDPARPDTCGIVRAVRSDKFACLDNTDLTFALMQGIRAAGLSLVRSNSVATCATIGSGSGSGPRVSRPWRRACLMATAGARTQHAWRSWLVYIPTWCPLVLSRPMTKPAAVR